MLAKGNPAPEWIADIRSRFPCETEIDRVLTRKLTRRAGPSYSPVSLEGMTTALERMLAANVDGPFSIARARWLSGGASKLQVAFDLTWAENGGDAVTKPMVLRMEPAESIVETSRLREFELIRAVGPHIPVPPVYWVDNEGEHLPFPGLVYGLVTGVAKPSGRVSRVSALGVDYGPELRPVLARQFLDHLTIMHKLDPAELPLGAFDMPSTPTQAAEWQINWWRRVWEEDANESIPLLEVAEAWMRDNLPTVDRHCLVHGDFRNGNFLFDEGTGKITAWLDWELGHIGDRHEDLAWVIARCFGHFAEDGMTFLSSGLFTESAFLEAYEKASGLPVDRKTLRFYLIFVLYKCVVLTIGTGYRVVHGGKTHQDALVAWLMAIGYVIMDELHGLLEEV